MVYFNNLHQTIINFIQDADFQLDIVICWFTHPQIFEALTVACRRKVKVRLILNFDQINFHPQGLEFEYMETLGAEVYAYTAPDLCHHKYMVADRCRVLSGSYNWTRATHQDYLLLTDSCQAATQFTEEFDRLLSACRPLGTAAKPALKQVLFPQLYQPLWWRWSDMKKQIARGVNIWTVRYETLEQWQAAEGRQQHFLPIKPAEQALLQRQAEAVRTALEQAGLAPVRRRLLWRYLLKVRSGDVFLAVSPGGIVWGIGMVGEGLGILTEPNLCFYRFISWRAFPERMPAPLALRLSRTPLGVFRGSGMALLDKAIVGG